MKRTSLPLSRSASTKHGSYRPGELCIGHQSSFYRAPESSFWQRSKFGVFPRWYPVSSLGRVSRLPSAKVGSGRVLDRIDQTRGGLWGSPVA